LDDGYQGVPIPASEVVVSWWPLIISASLPDLSKVCSVSLKKEGKNAL